MENHVASLLREAFDSTDLYEILGIEKTSDVALIKQAYRKQALKYHPDRANGDAKKFQALSAAHLLLSDENKRKEYDETGNLDENSSAEGNDFESWYEYFRTLFPALSTTSIDDFAMKYRGSEEETIDVLELYQRFQGDLFMMFNYIICSDDENSEERICSIIDNAIAISGRSSSSSAASSDSACPIVEFPKYEKSKAKFLANKAKRMKSYKKQKTSSSSSSSSSSASSIISLEQQILARREQRSKASVDNIYAKYVVGGKKGGKSKGKGKNNHDNKDVEEEEDDISDESFEALQERMMKKKPDVSSSSSSSTSNTKVKNKK